MKWNPFYWI